MFLPLELKIKIHAADNVCWYTSKNSKMYKSNYFKVHSNFRILKRCFEYIFKTYFTYTVSNHNSKHNRYKTLNEKNN